MSIHQLDPADGALDALIAEHINTLMHRARVSGRQVAAATGISQPTISRKLRGGAWSISEVVALCGYFGVTLDEMTTGLPTRDEWEARDLRGCRDSNPRPSDLSSTRQYVKAALTGNRAPRHLWAVAS